MSGAVGVRFIRQLPELRQWSGVGELRPTELHRYRTKYISEFHDMLGGITGGRGKILSAYKNRSRVMQNEHI
jgi:hypothetical protein